MRTAALRPHLLNVAIIEHDAADAIADVEDPPGQGRRDLGSGDRFHGAALPKNIDRR
jgi:hypothetical protein